MRDITKNINFTELYHSNLWFSYNFIYYRTESLTQHQLFDNVLYAYLWFFLAYLYTKDT